ncbi:MAG TPA: outer membrane lipoprotein carrier protein LolA [Pseudonocardiaceae bacterium]|jgi:outer membrane lipoprotein-sorting protein|nr:outer membrane lipoprotein carrier protein LolA [Pseudonocardiaceae bacterium]
MNRRKATLGVALAGVVAGAVALGLVAAPAGAGQSPTLPKTTPDALVQSVLTAKVPAMAGTVEVDNNLGLPAVPGIPQAASGTSQLRVWTDGQNRSRVSIPTSSSEQTIVDDGTTLYAWNSADRTVAEHALRKDAKDAMDKAKQQDLDPATVAKNLVSAIKTTSTVTVDGTDTVASRPAYDLVLTPKPAERTLLREVRISVDAQTRIPLRLTVLADNTDTPAVQIGFSSVDIGPQDPSLFRFTVPPGATVSHGDQNTKHSAEVANSTDPKLVGNGWDTVIVAHIPTQQPNDSRSVLSMVRQFGTPVHGTWGSGWVIKTDVANALLTSDGRVAAGFVPQQVLIQALGGAK